jgi:hypothetical protein
MRRLAEAMLDDDRSGAAVEEGAADVVEVDPSLLAGSLGLLVPAASASLCSMAFLRTSSNLDVYLSRAAGVPACHAEDERGDNVRVR